MSERTEPSRLDRLAAATPPPRDRGVDFLRAAGFFAVWSVVIVGMHLLDVGAPTGPRIWPGTTLLRLFLPPGATLPFGPLWFLAVYLVVVCIAPWMVDLHRRYRWGVVAT